MAEALLRKILVVDDEQDLADLAAALLRCHGLATRVGYCAAEALGILEEDRDIDSVFSDVMMPGMSGLELAQEIRKRYPHIRIVLTTGHTPPGLLAGPGPRFPCTPKPYRIATIIGLLGA